MSLLEILCLNKPQTHISYAEPRVQCCVNVMQLILFEGAARYRDSVELLQNWFKNFLIAANLNFSWHTVACMTQRYWTEIPDPGDLFALSCDSFFALLNGENDALSHKCKSSCTEYLCSLKITLRRVSSPHSSSSCYLFSILPWVAAGQVILVSRAVRLNRDPGMRAVAVHCPACGF